MPLVLSANVEAAAHRCKPGQGNRGLKREAAALILAIDTRAAAPGVFGSFCFLEIVQRRFQQRGLSNATGPGINDKGNFTGYFKLHAERVDVFHGIEVRLHRRIEQRFGEGIDVVLQIAQGLVQHALQASLFFNQLLQILTVDFPCRAVPLGHLRPWFSEGFHSRHRRLFYRVGYGAEYTIVMNAVVWGGRFQRVASMQIRHCFFTLMAGLELTDLSTHA